MLLIRIIGFDWTGRTKKQSHPVDIEQFSLFTLIVLHCEVKEWWKCSLDMALVLFEADTEHDIDLMWHINKASMEAFMVPATAYLRTRVCACEWP